MKILRRILYCILALIVLLCGLILLCALKPEITESIVNSMNLNRQEEVYLDKENTALPESHVLKPETAAPMQEVGGEQEQVQDKSSLVKEPENGSLTETANEGLASDTSSEYLPPSQSEIVIPKEVSGKSGYQEIQDKQEQVDEKEAGRLQKQLDVGNTGDGLAFDPVYYPYYAMLDETGKHLYRQIYANANALYPVFAPIEAVTPGELKNVFSAVYGDHPELFWMDTAYSGKFRGNGQCVEIDLQFNRTAQDLENAKAVFYENADQILAQAQSLSGNYEKEKFVHDALIDRITYNLGAEMNQSAYSALVNGQTVCAGYARAFQYLLLQLGIPCYYCTGYAGENHAWNIVALEDGYYNVDTTWDDTGSGTYDYFNKTDADYASTHIRKELSVYLPPCNGQVYRNLEQTTEQEQPQNLDDGLRSLEDVGMTKEQVITDLQKYYEDCYDQIVQNGIGTYTFTNVIESEELLEQWMQNYQNDSYRQAYMENALAAVGGSSCEMTLETEQLQGDKYLVTHTVTIR